MNRSILKVFILIIVSFDLVFSNQSHGSSCIVKAGIFGICVDISSCSQLRTLLESGKISRDDITICNADLRYLCCPFPSFEEESTSSTAPKVEVFHGTTLSALEKIKSTESTTTESIFEEIVSQEHKNEARKLSH